MPMSNIFNSVFEKSPSFICVIIALRFSKVNTDDFRDPPFAINVSGGLVRASALKFFQDALYLF